MPTASGKSKQCGHRAGIRGRQVRCTTGNPERDYPGKSPLLNALLGRDLPFWGIFLFIALALGQVAVHFERFSAKPVPAAGAQFFPESLNYQCIDVPVWVMTGAMLPYNAPEVRAMRPLYPAAISFARFLGFIHYPPEIRNAPPGSYPTRLTNPAHASGVRILRGFNVTLVAASLWIFFAAARRFGLPPLSAAFASYAAGAGFGFSFWVTQAVPEVFGYFTSVAALAGIVIGLELDNCSVSPRPYLAQFIRWATIGLGIGILLLGKELFYLPVLGGLILLGTRRWAGLAGFCIFIILPTVTWNHYMANIVGPFEPVKYLQEYKFVVWLWQDLGPLSWGERTGRLWTNLVNQVQALFRAFAYVPVVLAMAGAISTRPIPRQTLFLSVFFFSVYLLFLASNFIMPRLMFLTWPVIYLLAWHAVRQAGTWIAQRLTANASKVQHGTQAFEVAVLLVLISLGLTHQFRWYYYG